MAIRCQISFWLNPGSSKMTKVRFGTVDDVKVTLTSTITTHPLVNGDMISDHMYNEPISITINGTFSEHGTPYTTEPMQNMTLAELQQMFEKVKRNGILCEIIKIDDKGGELSSRFLKRSNMALTSITWTEKVNSIGFDFTFNEVLTATIESDIVDETDSNLPNITGLEAANFTSVALDWNEAYAALIQGLKDEDLISDEFWNDFEQRLRDTGLSAGIGLSAGLAIGLTVSGPVGLIAGALAFVGLEAYNSVKNIIKKIKRANYKGIAPFTNYDEDIDRFNDLINNFTNLIKLLDNDILFYKFTNDGPQIAYGNIEGEYYTFSFDVVKASENKTQRYSVTDASGRTRGIISHEKTPTIYSLVVRNYEEKVTGQCADITSSPTSFSSCVSSNYLFKTSTGKYGYLLALGDDLGYITNYGIVVSSVTPNNYYDYLYEIIKEAVIYE